MRFLLHSILFTFFFTSVAFAEPPASGEEGIVVNVVDGDKINVSSQGLILKIRVYGIDAPEKMKSNPKTGQVTEAGQPYGEEAWKALKSKVFHQKVQLEIMDSDLHGRIVAIVRLGGRDIGREMVAEGWAWADRGCVHDACAAEYRDAEERARRKKRGLWQQHKPEPPWEFRRLQKILMQLHSPKKF